ncbi:hypothetical protein [Halostagnicola sp. A-GB9-2]|uniref:hypothetical protein n=1 Tax=Halostagnicola sp. A-GB9-2 TaxID=3048066 RepID=UPI0024BF7DFB|nr:hypothetical protein [Halostagnicola sp. A-GB9-2]MDJ1430970.1 hypothetical protein [Halostagnicola sp. A-GB9-2]
MPIGTNVYDREWDMLVILDACRVDAIEEVAPEYEFIESVDSIRSVGSTSFEWMPLTFTREHEDDIAETSYITGNPYTESVFERKDHPPVRDAIPFGPTDYDVVDDDDFDHLEELWKYEQAGDFNRKPPRFTTDRAISTARSRDPEKLIVHYMYPHNPFPLADEGLEKPFDDLKAGNVSRETVWELYLENLRYVLDDVELLLESTDMDRVVITADHGEAFGEYGFYKHIIGCPLPCVRRVPWIRTSAVDTETYEPDREELPSRTTSAEERLKGLGYL